MPSQISKQHSHFNLQTLYRNTDGSFEACSHWNDQNQSHKRLSYAISSTKEKRLVNQISFQNQNPVSRRQSIRFILSKNPDVPAGWNNPLIVLTQSYISFRVLKKQKMA